MSFLAIGFWGVVRWGCWRFVVELVAELGWLVPLKLEGFVRWDPLAGGGSGFPLLMLSLLTSTQSGSGLGVKGLLGRAGFGINPSAGGWTRALAGRPSKDKHGGYKGEKNQSTIAKPPLSPI